MDDQVESGGMAGGAVDQVVDQLGQFAALLQRGADQRGGLRIGEPPGVSVSGRATRTTVLPLGA